MGYSYPDDAICQYEVKTFIFGDILLIFRGEGFIDAFNVKTRELLWEAEVRGRDIKGFEVDNDFLSLLFNLC